MLGLRMCQTKRSANAQLALCVACSLCSGDRCCHALGREGVVGARLASVCSDPAAGCNRWRFRQHVAHAGPQDRARLTQKGTGEPLVFLVLAFVVLGAPRRTHKAVEIDAWLLRRRAFSLREEHLRRDVRAITGGKRSQAMRLRWVKNNRTALP